MASCLIGFGANLGARENALQSARRLLDQVDGLQVAKVSGLRDTPAVGGPVDQPVFLNAALLLETTLAPRQLLQALFGVEQALGRQRGQRWAARTIDLDLLLYDQQVLDEPGLVVPHPRFAFRRFALEPAAEIAGTMKHPLIGWTLQRLLQHLNSTPAYVAVTADPGENATQLVSAVAAGDDRIVAAAGPPGAQMLDARSYYQAGVAAIRHALSEFGGQWLLSDFWCEQARALACGDSTDDARQTTAEPRGELDVRPKLLVIVEAEPQNADHARRQGALRRLATQPQRGPWLRLSAHAPDASREELRAALDAMTPLT
jgi:2-amino-4-hydroxy-6-hydroxymethyldihydropteridine diphosphokinase